MWNEGHSSLRAHGVHTRETQPRTATVDEENPTELSNVAMGGGGWKDQHYGSPQGHVTGWSSTHISWLPDTSSQLCHVLSENFHVVTQFG